MHALKVKRLEIPKYQKSLAADKQKGSKHDSQKLSMVTICLREVNNLSLKYYNKTVNIDVDFD